MPVPKVNSAPPFEITRASHVRLCVADLDRSLRFYEELVGLVVTEREADIAYLRGVEEVCHHSLVLTRSGDGPACECIGMRVAGDAEIDRAAAALAERGIPIERIDVPHQGATLRFADPSGAAIELCGSMATLPRYSVAYDERKGAAPIGLDHYQLHVRDDDLATTFYADLGFRTSEFITMGGSPDEPLLGSFLARKGNANDLVMVRNVGPRLHHFSYVIHDAPVRMVALCDRAAAMGVADAVEWGPSRHGLGDEIFLYLRDPDGHRLELLSHPYLFVDLEEEPLGWSRREPKVPKLWGPDAPASWFEEASVFVGVEPAEPVELAGTDR